MLEFGLLSEGSNQAARLPWAQTNAAGTHYASGKVLPSQFLWYTSHPCNRMAQAGAPAASRHAIALIQRYAMS